ncbi:MAG: hypothetical protein AAF501_05475 [Pseudomonadota bacterium]
MFSWLVSLARNIWIMRCIDRLSTHVFACSTRVAAVEPVRPSFGSCGHADSMRLIHFDVREATGDMVFAMVRVVVDRQDRVEKRAFVLRDRLLGLFSRLGVR